MAWYQYYCIYNVYIFPICHFIIGVKPILRVSLHSLIIRLAYCLCYIIVIIIVIIVINDVCLVKVTYFLLISAAAARCQFARFY